MDRGMLIEMRGKNMEREAQNNATQKDQKDATIG